MKNTVAAIFILFFCAEFSLNIYASGSLDSDNDGLADSEEIFVFGDELMINTYTPNYQWFPDISSNGSNYMAVWQSDRQDGQGYGVYMQMIDPNGNKITLESLVNSFTTQNQSTPSVTTDGTNYFVAWQSDTQDGNDYGIFGRIYNENGNTQMSEFQINTYTTSWQTGPNIAYNGTNYLVVWQSEGQDGSNSGIFGQLLNSAGTKIGTEFQINTYTTGDQSTPSIASDGENYFVTWQSIGQDGSQSGIFGQLFDNDANKIGTEFQINTYTADKQDSPDVSSGGHRYLVAWQSMGQDGNFDGIYAQLFDSAGNKIGDETLINTYTAGNQKYPNITSDGHNFALVWHSFSQDGDTYGIFSKISSGCGTDYLNPDTDGDGMNDGFEVRNNLNPFIDDSSGDLDNDGLSNIDESNNGTSPANADTDNDGLIDAIEVNQLNTNPLNPDTDGDGMYDGDEVYVGMEPDNADSLFAIKSITLNETQNNMKIMWYGSVSNTDIEYKILWSHYPWTDWHNAEPDNADIMNDGGIRSWIDEGDNDTLTPRSQPAGDNSRFYKIVVQ